MLRFPTALVKDNMANNTERIGKFPEMLFRIRIIDHFHLVKEQLDVILLCLQTMRACIVVLELSSLIFTKLDNRYCHVTKFCLPVAVTVHYF